MRDGRLCEKLFVWLLLAALAVLALASCAPTQPREDATSPQPASETNSQTEVGQSETAPPTSDDPGKAPDQAAPSPGNQESGAGESTPVESSSETEIGQDEPATIASEDSAQASDQPAPGPVDQESESGEGAPVESSSETELAQEETAATVSEDLEQAPDQAVPGPADQESEAAKAISQGNAESGVPIDSTDSGAADAAPSAQDDQREPTTYWTPFDAPTETAEPPVNEPPIDQDLSRDAGESSEAGAEDESCAASDEAGVDLAELEYRMQLATTLQDYEGTYAATGFGAGLCLTIYGATDDIACGHLTWIGAGTTDCVVALRTGYMLLRFPDSPQMTLQIVTPAALRIPGSFTVLHKQ